MCRYPLSVPVLHPTINRSTHSPRSRPFNSAETKYIIFKLSDDNKEIVVEKTSESSNYDEFVAELPGESCRYAIYDFEYEKGNDGKRNKIVFIAW